LISLLDSYLNQAENGLHLGFFKLTLPAGAADGILGLIMVVMLIVRPRGLTGGREWDLGLPRVLRRGRGPAPAIANSARTTTTAAADEPSTVQSAGPER
jgi:hypothetical protein